MDEEINGTQVLGTHVGYSDHDSVKSRSFEFKRDSVTSTSSSAFVYKVHNMKSRKTNTSSNLIKIVIANRI